MTSMESINIAYDYCWDMKTVKMRLDKLIEDNKKHDNRSVS